MEFRNVIKSGNTSYVISLPRRWILKNQIEKGSVLSIQENRDGSLIITPEKKELKKTEKEYSINLDETTPETFRRQLVSCYINGYTTLIIRGKNITSYLKMIKDSLEELIAFEIMEIEKERIVIRDCLNFGEMNFEDIIRKMDINIRGMFEEVLNSLEKLQITETQISSIGNMDKNLNRLNFLCEKIAREALEKPPVANALGVSPLQSFIAVNTSAALENIGDNLKNLMKHLKNSLSREEKVFIRKQCLLSFENYKNAMEAYFKRDKRAANQVSDEKHRIREKNEEFFAKKKNMSIAASRAIERIQMIESMIGIIMRTIIDMV
ncbi:MAG: AbrB/MazE/SpoVT family DNA-binding domain-containing protein [Candidatus Woesearchaeota archaeon]